MADPALRGIPITCATSSIVSTAALTPRAALPIAVLSNPVCCPPKLAAACADTAKSSLLSANNPGTAPGRASRSAALSACALSPANNSCRPDVSHSSKAFFACLISS